MTRLKADSTKSYLLLKKKTWKYSVPQSGKRFENKIQVEYAFQGLDTKIPNGYTVPEGRGKTSWHRACIALVADYVHENLPY